MDPVTGRDIDMSPLSTGVLNNDERHNLTSLREGCPTVLTHALFIGEGEETRNSRPAFPLSAGQCAGLAMPVDTGQPRMHQQAVPGVAADPWTADPGTTQCRSEAFNSPENEALQYEGCTDSSGLSALNMEELTLDELMILISGSAVGLSASPASEASAVSRFNEAPRGGELTRNALVDPSQKGGIGFGLMPQNETAADIPTPIIVADASLDEYWQACAASLQAEGADGEHHSPCVAGNDANMDQDVLSGAPESACGDPIWEELTWLAQADFTDKKAEPQAPTQAPERDMEGASTSVPGGLLCPKSGTDDLAELIPGDAPAAVLSPPVENSELPSAQPTANAYTSSGKFYSRPESVVWKASAGRGSSSHHARASYPSLHNSRLPGLMTDEAITPRHARYQTPEFTPGQESRCPEFPALMPQTPSPPLPQRCSTANAAAVLESSCPWDCSHGAEDSNGCETVSRYYLSLRQVHSISSSQNDLVQQGVLQQAAETAPQQAAADTVISKAGYRTPTGSIVSIGAVDKRTTAGPVEPFRPEDNRRRGCNAEDQKGAFLVTAATSLNGGSPDWTLGEPPRRTHARTVGHIDKDGSLWTVADLEELYRRAVLSKLKGPAKPAAVQPGSSRATLGQIGGKHLSTSAPVPHTHMQGEALVKQGLGVRAAAQHRTEQPLAAEQAVTALLEGKGTGPRFSMGLATSPPVPQTPSSFSPKSRAVALATEEWRHWPSVTQAAGLEGQPRIQNSGDFRRCGGMLHGGDVWHGVAPRHLPVRYLEDFTKRRLVPLRQHADRLGFAPTAAPRGGQIPTHSSIPPVTPTSSEVPISHGFRTQSCPGPSPLFVSTKRKWGETLGGRSGEPQPSGSFSAACLQRAHRRTSSDAAAGCAAFSGMSSGNGWDVSTSRGTPAGWLEDLQAQRMSLSPLFKRGKWLNPVPGGAGDRSVTTGNSQMALSASQESCLQTGYFPGQRRGVLDGGEGQTEPVLMLPTPVSGASSAPECPGSVTRVVGCHAVSSGSAKPGKQTFLLSGCIPISPSTFSSLR